MSSEYSLSGMDAYKLATPPEYERDEPEDNADVRPDYDAMIGILVALERACELYQQYAAEARACGLDAGHWDKRVRHCTAGIEWLNRGAP